MNNSRDQATNNKNHKATPLPYKWRDSRAQQILREMIENGELAESEHPSALYARNIEGEFQKFDYKRQFCSGINRLRKLTAIRKQNAAWDQAAFNHDRALNPIPQLTNQGVPWWPGSKAEETLKNDIVNGLHERLKPQTLYNLRPTIYHKFPLTKFREHLYQEVRSQKGASYWLKWKQDHQRT